MNINYKFNPSKDNLSQKNSHERRRKVQEVLRLFDLWTECTLRELVL